MNRTYTFHFLLSQAFCQLSLASALWPLQTANRLLGETCFQWQCWRGDSCEMISDTGLAIQVPIMKDLPDGDWFFLLGNDTPFTTPHLMTLATDAMNQFTNLGAIGSATATAAELGWLKGYQAVLHKGSQHWPDIRYRQDQFVIDRQRVTCRGGTAALDMMIMLIGRELGGDVAKSLAQLLIEERLGRQGRVIRKRLLAFQKQQQPKLAEAIELMEANIEEPLHTEEVAQHVGLSKRQLERLFKHYLEEPPSRYYLLVRIEYGHRLLLNSARSISDIALECGFSSSAHFSTAYRGIYEQTPSDVRR